MKLTTTLALAGLTTLAAAVAPRADFPESNYNCLKPDAQVCNLDNTLTRCKDGEATIFTCEGPCQCPQEGDEPCRKASCEGEQPA